jgi:hypothetical protein
MQNISAQQNYSHSQPGKVKPVNVSFIIEWANTEYNGVPRFFTLLLCLIVQSSFLNA